MKKIFVIMFVAAVAGLYSCDKDPKPNDGPDKTGTATLNGGSLVLKNYPNSVKITTLNEFPVGTTASRELSKSTKSRLAEGDATTAPDEMMGNNYRFKLIGEMSTLTINDVEVQASHVKLEKVDKDHYFAFVSYNSKGDRHMGGVAIYKVDLVGDKLVDKTATITEVAIAEMSNAEISAVDFSGNKLYLTGASENPNFGYNPEKQGHLAFYMVLNLNTDRTFDLNYESGKVFCQQLTSYQGTDVKYHNDRVYVTTGDGAENTDGGLYIFNGETNETIKTVVGVQYDHVRSVTADDDNVFVMQAEPARVIRFNLSCDNSDVIYSSTNEAMQPQAKSEIALLGNDLFISENETGLRMLDKSTGEVLDQLTAPGYGEEGWNAETMVTNSVSVNADEKLTDEGKLVQSNLLLLANGEKGIYWYDVATVNNKDKILLCNGNSILGGGNYSANHVASVGNIAFVADGLGGLKVLYIGFNPGDTPPPIDNDACDEFMSFLMKFGDETFGLLPEHQSVFTSTNTIVKTLFSDATKVPNYLTVKEDTKLYLNFIGEGAGWQNALGYFVIPADVTDEWNYFENNIKNDLFNQVISQKYQTYVVNSKYLIFSNVDQNVIAPKSKFEIGNFKAGDKVVFFMIPTGWNAQNNRVEAIQNENEWLRPFYTHKGINENTRSYFDDSFGTFKGITYNTFYSPDCQSIVMLFEDVHFGNDPEMNDHDYNDIVFSINDDLGVSTKIEHPAYSIKKNLTTGEPELSVN